MTKDAKILNKKGKILEGSALHFFDGTPVLPKLLQLKQ
jgi:hypothetical protein